MEEEKSNLFSFLENFDTENYVKIYDETNIIYDGVVGDVPQRVSSKREVVKCSVKNRGSFISITVKNESPI